MIRAIETKYKGYRFRSRLEARWAVFFDSVGLQWEYEKEGFDLGTLGWYLPDFWIMNSIWVEIKPQLDEENLDAINKCFALSQLSKKTAIVIFGNPWWSEYQIHGYFFRNDQYVGGYSDYTFDDRGRLVFTPIANINDSGGRTLNFAYIAARSARFEHGETGN